MKGSDKFETVRTYDPIAKKHRQYQTAHCYKCGAFENLPVTGTSALPPPPLIKQLQHRGWVMGTSRKHDMCPDCVKEAAEARRKAKSTGTVVDFHPQPPITTTIPMNSPPETKPLAETVTTTRHPTREDKRLIILEIENHYLGADKGYTTGASDETVAKSLNVPLKWVADLREEFFGPVVNPEIAKLSADIAALVTRMDNHEREGRDIRAKAMEMKGAGRPRWSALMLLTLSGWGNGPDCRSRRRPHVEGEGIGPVPPHAGMDRARGRTGHRC